MFNQTNMIVGSLYAISLLPENHIALEILKLVENEGTNRKNAGKENLAPLPWNTCRTYRKRVDKISDLLDSSDVSYGIRMRSSI